jgi:hypothetical protein
MVFRRQMQPVQRQSDLDIARERGRASAAASVHDTEANGRLDPVTRGAAKKRPTLLGAGDGNHPNVAIAIGTAEVRKAAWIAC